MSYNEPTSPGSMASRRGTNRNTNRYSVTALFSMAAEQDVEVEDDLARGEYLETSLGSSYLTDIFSTKTPSGLKGQNLCSIQEELCVRAGRLLS